MLLALFYLSLIVAVATIFIVAIKGLIELLAPIRAAKRKEASKK